ncbi:poly-beta-1,6-N-acetyl-D-glucosamine biosynthesis protein PgaD [Dyella sp.]|uniref:poly-beta-1,6-N-acetyl-D-glucosamine biosynthesis protein PgaD n=1 Tax=Dyella sp. TaxID=1869338 RepID=UPI002ED45110
MKADAIMIQRPEHQRPLQRVMFGAITVVAWVIWASLWIPLITALAWTVGLGDVYVQLDLGHPLHGGGDLDIVLVDAVACVSLFCSWSGYNHLRFAGKEKRRGNKPVTVEQVARGIGASTITAKTMQGQRRSVVYVSDDGRMSLTSKD